MVRLNKDALRNTQLSFYRASKPIATNGRPLTRPKAMAADAFVARTLAGRRHVWVYGSMFPNYVQGATLAGSGNDSLVVYRMRRLGWLTASTSLHGRCVNTCLKRWMPMEV